MKRAELKALLDRACAQYSDRDAISWQKPDPLLIAREQREDWAVLLCALFGYGSVRAIVGFLDEIDFETGRAPERGYRFQSREDVTRILAVLPEVALEECFYAGYRTAGVPGGIARSIEAIEAALGEMTPGLRFLIGKRFDPLRLRGVSAHKRWLMFARWMGRRERPDLGRWSWLCPADLIMPLDTHTFRLGQKLRLIKRKSADFEAALEMTRALKRFCREDPIRYDFALYRLGQEGKL